MSAMELAEWIAYFSAIEPMPSAARDAAQICAVLANVNRTRGPAFHARDFLPRVVAGPTQTTEQMMAEFNRITGS
jgi:hypothetical protein